VEGLIDFETVVGKVVLLRDRKTNDIVEALVVKVSPSKKYVKVFDGTAVRWISALDYELLEALYD